MFELRSRGKVESGASRFAPDIPHEFLRLPQGLQQPIDRRLGYFGQGRFVFFYYEPRGDEVMWNDGRTYGFGTGGWEMFHQDIAPLAEQHGMNVGVSGRRAEHALVLDRERREAYLAEREAAEEFVQQQG